MSPGCLCRACLAVEMTELERPGNFKCCEDVCLSRGDDMSWKKSGKYPHVLWGTVALINVRRLTLSNTTYSALFCPLWSVLRLGAIHKFIGLDWRWRIRPSQEMIDLSRRIAIYNEFGWFGGRDLQRSDDVGASRTLTSHQPKRLICVREGS